MFQQWPSLTAMPAMHEIQRRRLAWIHFRFESVYWGCCMFFLLPLLLLMLLQAAHCSRNVRYTVFFRRTVDFSRKRYRWLWRSSTLRTFRLGRPF